MDPQQTQAQAMHMMAAMLPLIALFMAIGAVIYIVPLWQICKKAGLPGPLSLIAIVPYVGQLIVLYIVAFSSWKVGPLPPPMYTSNYPPPPAYPPANYPPQGPTA
jgi:hypothetical protein